MLLNIIIAIELSSYDPCSTSEPRRHQATSATASTAVRGTRGAISIQLRATRCGRRLPKPIASRFSAVGPCAAPKGISIRKLDRRTVGRDVAPRRHQLFPYATYACAPTVRDQVRFRLPERARTGPRVGGVRWAVAWMQ
uniref:Uncharacterized protein n=1 Tax=Sipha flava TaxID=143950 RepID=A0A2S2QUU5_9HEMI